MVDSKYYDQTTALQKKLAEQKAAVAAAAKTANAQRATQTDEGVDHQLLNFGKYKGQTPSDIAQTEEGASWLVWAYANVKNRTVCSELLARDCGWRPPLSTKEAAAVKKNVGKTTDNFDDYDDDIPF